MPFKSILSTLVLSLSVFACGGVAAHAQEITQTPQRHHYVTLDKLLEWYTSENEVMGGLAYGYVVGVYDTLSQAEAICGSMGKAAERVEDIMEVTAEWARQSRIERSKSASLVLIDVIAVMYECPDQPKPKSKYF